MLQPPREAQHLLQRTTQMVTCRQRLHLVMMNKTITENKIGTFLTCCVYSLEQIVVLFH